MDLKHIIEQTYSTIDNASKELDLPVKFLEGMIDGSIGIYIAPMMSIQKLINDSKYIELEDIIASKERDTANDRNLLETMLTKYNTKENTNKYKCDKLEYLSNLISLREVNKNIIEIEKELEIRNMMDNFNSKYGL